MLVVLVQLALAGGGALACANHPVRPAANSVSTAGASAADMGDMAGMPGMPAHGGDRTSDEGDCPSSGMPSDDCQAMSACASIVAIAADAESTAAAAVRPGSMQLAQRAPRSFAHPPEAPPPRA